VTALAPHEAVLATEQTLDGTLASRLQDNAYHLPIDAPVEVWEADWHVLNTIEKRIQWWVGDCLLAGEARFPDHYSQACEATDYQASTLYGFAWVCRVFPPGTRRPELSFGHHKAVAGVEDPDARNAWLDEAIERGWSVGELTARRNGILLTRPRLPKVQLPSADGLAVRDVCTRLLKTFAVAPEASTDFTLPTLWGSIHVELIVD